jgi:tetraacyldisaccharide 4'-kinase
MWRKVLFSPISLLLYCILRIRHFLFDHQILPSYRASIPLISIGNLSIGGAGKSPFVVYLVELFKQDIADFFVLSRGYGRSSKGEQVLCVQDSVEKVGDEALQLKKKFPALEVIVNANRAQSIQKLERKFKFGIMDDAFQHRKVRPGLQIVLLPYAHIIQKETFLFPMGKHRDIMQRLHAANMLIVSKCPDNPNIKAIEQILKSYNKPIYFTGLEYDAMDIPAKEKVLVLTGIADASGFIHHIQKQYHIQKHFEFSDHHHFKQSELEGIRKYAKEHDIRYILTTEKDAQRIPNAFFEEKGVKIKAWGIKVTFLAKEAEFKEYITQYVRSN